MLFFETLLRRFFSKPAIQSPYVYECTLGLEGSCHGFVNSTYQDRKRNKLVTQGRGVERGQELLTD